MDRQTIIFVVRAAEDTARCCREGYVGAVESLVANAFEDFAQKLLSELPDEEPQP